MPLDTPPAQWERRADAILVHGVPGDTAGPADGAEAVVWLGRGLPAGHRASDLMCQARQWGSGAVVGDEQTGRIALHSSIAGGGLQWNAPRLVPGGLTGLVP